MVPILSKYFGSTLPLSSGDCGHEYDGDCCHCLSWLSPVLGHYVNNSVGCDNPSLDTEPNIDFHGCLVTPLCYFCCPSGVKRNISHEISWTTHLSSNMKSNSAIINSSLCIVCMKWAHTVKVMSICPYTECHSWVISSPASYSVGSGFRFWPGDLLSWLRFFVVFCSVSRQMLG
jgi:hypothetical protein